MKVYKIVNTLNIGQVLIQTIVWILLIVFTFGLALPFFTYFFVKLILNTTEIHEIDASKSKARISDSPGIGSNRKSENTDSKGW